MPYGRHTSENGTTPVPQPRHKPTRSYIGQLYLKGIAQISSIQATTLTCQVSTRSKLSGIHPVCTGRSPPTLPSPASGGGKGGGATARRAGTHLTHGARRHGSRLSHPRLRRGSPAGT